RPGQARPGQARPGQARPGQAKPHVRSAHPLRGALSVISIALLLCACAETERGVASFYADSLQGNPTANGDRYDKDALTAAHLTLPFDTEVTVTYPKTGKSVVVVVNDRGPYVEGRIIDLSRAAATAIGLTEDGVGEVVIKY
ncbi:MAG: septal ring lytic transglycosylase RlpA family protein, partial [Pseudomonadota bacterium]